MLITRVGFAAALSVVLLASGCGELTGVDGNLVNNWGTISEPTGFNPVADTCHLGNFVTVGTRDTYEEVGCALKHRTETIYVGTYQNPAAEAPAPPTDGSAGAREAYRICDEQTTVVVGAPWRTGRLWIGVTQPSDVAWTGGARWFRCEVLEISSIEDDGGLVQRLGSVTGALKPASSTLRLTCYAIKLDSAGAINTMPPADCTKTHNAEFAGIWNAGALNFPVGDNQWGQFHDGCRKVISTYAGVPNDRDLQYRTGVVSLPGGEDVWALGDRGVRCYLWLDGAKLTTSLKGKGTKGMPIQYK